MAEIKIEIEIYSFDPLQPIMCELFFFLFSFFASGIHEFRFIFQAENFNKYLFLLDISLLIFVITFGFCFNIKRFYFFAFFIKLFEHMLKMRQFSILAGQEKPF